MSYPYIAFNSNQRKNAETKDLEYQGEDTYRIQHYSRFAEVITQFGFQHRSECIEISTQNKPVGH